MGSPWTSVHSTMHSSACASAHTRAGVRLMSTVPAKPGHTSASEPKSATPSSRSLSPDIRATWGTHSRMAARNTSSTSAFPSSTRSSYAASATLAGSGTVPATSQTCAVVQGTSCVMSNAPVAPAAKHSPPCTPRTTSTSGSSNIVPTDEHAGTASPSSTTTAAAAARAVRAVVHRRIPVPPSCARLVAWSPGRLVVALSSSGRLVAGTRVPGSPGPVADPDAAFRPPSPRRRRSSGRRRGSGGPAPRAIGRRARPRGRAGCAGRRRSRAGTGPRGRACAWPGG